MQKRIITPSIQPVENVHADYLFVSDNYQVKSWAFSFDGSTPNSTGYNDCFCFTMVRQGNFLFDYASKENDMYSGHIIVEKSNFEYSLRPASGCCTIFNFSDDFYLQLVEDLQLQHSLFFSNRRHLSILMLTTPEIEYLHHQVLVHASFAGKLEMDNLVFELVRQVVMMITDEALPFNTDTLLLRYHLGTVEKAKAFMNEHFYKDISLQDISLAAHVSQFHFSRIFKKITQCSPYQYLSAVRLKHAEMLLKNSDMAIGEVGLRSGFNNIEHFATIFKQRYRLPPVEYRRLTK